MEPYSKEPATLIEHVFPGDTNAYDTLFGGKLLSLMDKAGGIACAKFAHREFVTISIDALTFIAPARQGDLLEVTGKVVFTSSHTACTKVTAVAVNKATWEKNKICEGFFFFVAIDSMMRPIPIPQFVVEQDDEQEDWDHAKNIREQMLANRKK
jgi:acyl-CoA hydrolase